MEAWEGAPWGPDIDEAVGRFKNGLICRYDLRGYCFHGDACRYIHPRQQMAGADALFWPQPQGPAQQMASAEPEAPFWAQPQQGLAQQMPAQPLSIYGNPPRAPSGLPPPTAQPPPG